MSEEMGRCRREMTDAAFLDRSFSRLPTATAEVIADAIARLVAEIERHRMTPQEREAAGDAAAECDYDHRGMAIQGYLDRTEPEEDDGQQRRIVGGGRAWVISNPPSLPRAGV